MEASLSGQDIAFERRGVAGIVTLQRPRALNALTQDMVRRLDAALDAWQDDRDIHSVVIRSADARAFCAGGDIRALYDLGMAGRQEEALSFWQEEYVLNCRIKRYPKPYVGLIDGIVMGGGVGISLHGSHRVAGPNYSFAMPEVGIGFFPDVGATWVLPRLPGHTGTWLALTGARIGAEDAHGLGLVTDRVAAGSFDHIIEGLAQGSPVDEVVRHVQLEPAQMPLDAHRTVIDHCFAHPHIRAILGALDEAAAGSPFAAEAAATIRTRSPTSLSIALEQMRRGPFLDFEEAMRTEFRIVSRVVYGHDFYEGVRAMVIDKDRNPSWSPRQVEDVDRTAVEVYFEPLGDRELQSMVLRRGCG